MMLRRGFTLVEVMIALLIGSVVVALAYATLGAGLDTQRRVATARDEDAESAAMRAMLGDALRHAVSGDASDPLGMHTDESGSSLHFVTRGIDAPMGGSGRWQVSISADTAGVSMRAVSRDGQRTPLTLTARRGRDLAVRFLPDVSMEWRDRWDDPSRLPEAIELRVLDGKGRDVLPPLVARTMPVSGS
jgi:prepilin-type N-terminal cleavage/methylation domain-containing protein